MSSTTIWSTTGGRETARERERERGERESQSASDGGDVTPAAPPYRNSVATNPITVVKESFRNRLENAPVPDVVVAVGDEVPIRDAMMDVDVDDDEMSLALDAADDWIELAASGEIRESAAQAVVFA